MGVSKTLNAIDSAEFDRSRAQTRSTDNDRTCTPAGRGVSASWTAAAVFSCARDSRRDRAMLEFRSGADVHLRWPHVEV